MRTSWVIGEGKNFVATMASLAERGIDPAVVADQHGRLTFADDLADALVSAAAVRAVPASNEWTIVDRGAVPPPPRVAALLREASAR